MGNVMALIVNGTSILNANSSHQFWCKIETVSEARYARLITQVVVASNAIFFYIVVLALSAMGTFFETFRRLVSMQVSSILFLVGALAISINIFGNADKESIEAKLYYRITWTALVGIVFMVIGAWVFFEKPHSCSEECNPRNGVNSVQHCHFQTFGLQQPSMGLVVIIITFPLLVIELFLVLGTKTETKNETKEYKMLKALLLSDKSLLLFQKFVQVVTYLILRNITVSVKYRENTSFYFKILAFYNFEGWLDSVVSTDTDLQLTTAEVIYGPAFEIIETVYKALLIDYRLLCAVLFLEHALEVDEDNENERVENRPTGVRYVMTADDRMKRNLGYLIGLLCIIARVLTTVNYINKLRIGSWVHVLAILINVFIAVCGVVLLQKNNLTVQRMAHKERKGVKIIMCCMGAVGLTCWMVKGTLTALLVKEVSTDHKMTHFEWSAAKILTRGVGAAFLMVIYAKMEVKVIANYNQDIKINHLLVPALMLCILSEAVGSAIDQYKGSVEKKLFCVITDQSLRILLAGGPPMHLGFVIHVFLHFLVTHQMMIRVSRANESLAGEANDSGLTERLLPIPTADNSSE